MPEFHSDAAEFATESCSDFVKGYITAAYFTDTGGIEKPSSETTLSDEAFRDALGDCDDFQRAAKSLLNAAYESGEYTEMQAGHDYWFTRNGHGVGYWCRDGLDDVIAAQLTALAHKDGTIDLYEGDDGLLHFT